MQHLGCLKALLVSAIVATALGTQAAPLAVVEGGFGSEFSDLGGSPSVLGNLDVGANTVKGGMTHFPGVTDVEDWFQVGLPQGLTIVSATVQVTFIATCTGISTDCDRVLFQDNLADDTGFIYAIGSTLLPNAAVSADLADLDIVFHGLFQQLGSSSGGNVNYTLTLNVEPISSNVPEPASAAIVGLGALGLSLSRRRSSKP